MIVQFGLNGTWSYSDVAIPNVPLDTYRTDLSICEPIRNGPSISREHLESELQACRFDMTIILSV